jgi:hypothetical protein
MSRRTAGAGLFTQPRGRWFPGSSYTGSCIVPVQVEAYLPHNTPWSVPASAAIPPVTRMTQAPWCLRGPAWLLPTTKPALARPWDRQPGSPAHRSRLHVGSAMGCRRPVAHHPSAARQIRPGLQPLSPTSPPCSHLTPDYSPKLVEKVDSANFALRGFSEVWPGGAQRSSRSTCRTDRAELYPHDLPFGGCPSTRPAIAREGARVFLAGRTLEHVVEMFRLLGGGAMDRAEWLLPMIGEFLDAPMPEAATE